ncbi:MAG TPA: hypothetical protein VNZ48_06075 [Xanthobacteraceae bacterium]|jgi:hypothetical protein|nr:hypothetical protein [Xanthobacteraceae bacterium]
MDALEKILGLLAKALRETSSRKETIDEYLRCYSESALLIKRSIGQDADDVLGDLFVDLNYFVADPATRAQDSSYFGDERLEREIRAALHRLSELGIAAPKG